MLRNFPETRPAATGSPRKPARRWVSRSSRPASVRCSRSPTASSIWLRATTLETRRLAYWWADRMVATHRPLEEKMALFWHGHFATGDEQGARLSQNAGAARPVPAPGDRQFPRPADRRRAGSGHAGFSGCRPEREGRAEREFWPRSHGAVHHGRRQLHRARHPRSRPRLHRLDRRRPDLQLRPAKHDDGEKTFLGRTGRFDGVEVLDIILEQKVDGGIIAGKLYRFWFVSDFAGVQARLGRVLRDNNYEIAPLLRTMFLSRDFYSAPRSAPVSRDRWSWSYRHIASSALTAPARRAGFQRGDGGAGQICSIRRPLPAGRRAECLDHTRAAARARQLRPRRVVPRHDRFRRSEPDPGPRGRARSTRDPGRHGHQRAATEPDRSRARPAMDTMADGRTPWPTQERFNTRYASLKGWQEAARRMKPILRAPAQFSLDRDRPRRTGAHDHGRSGRSPARALA